MTSKRGFYLLFWRKSLLYLSVCFTLNLTERHRERLNSGHSRTNQGLCSMNTLGITEGHVAMAMRQRGRPISALLQSVWSQQRGRRSRTEETSFLSNTRIFFSMYIKFCRSYAEDKKDEAGENLSSKLSVELGAKKSRQKQLLQESWRFLLCSLTCV